MKGLELVETKRRLYGDLSPASALAILQKTPPTMVLTHDQTHDQTHAAASICSPFDGANFLKSKYLKNLKNSADHLWVQKKLILQNKL